METSQPLPLKYWGLQHWPFAAAPRVDPLYPAAALTEALARIEYLVEGGRRVGALVGTAGTGKSLTLQAAVRRLQRQRCAAVLVDVLGTTSRELLWQVAAGFGAAPSDDADSGRLWRRICDSAAENALQQVPCVLLVDNAGQAGPDVVTQLVRLARVDASRASRWTMVLAAEPQQALRWSESLRELVDLRIELGEWSLEETIGYVQTALVDAGRLEPVFEDAALAALHELARGNARQVARLADFALLAGAAVEAGTIGADTIEAAYAELAWPEAAFSP